MTTDNQVPDGHEWRKTHEWDKLLFECEDCEVIVPVTANDTQAGIRLYCPECTQEMDLNWEWKDDDR